MRDYSKESQQQKLNRIKLIQKELGLNQTGNWDKETNTKYEDLMKKKGVDANKLSEVIELKSLKSKLPQSSFKLNKENPKPVTNINPEVPESEDGFMDSISNLYTLGKNFIDRTFKKYTDDEGEMIENKPVVKENKVEQKLLQEKPIKALSDTIKDDNRKYRVPVSIDLDETSGFKTRNRKDNKEINTSSGALLSTFYPFVEKSKYKPILNGSLIGVDKRTGKVKVGNPNEFDDNYLVSETYQPEVITDIDLTGNQYDDNLKRPVIKGIRTDKSLANLPIGLGKDKSPNKLSDLSGGKILIATPDNSQLQFIYGTASQLKQELNNFKTKYKTDAVNLYHLDNGTYNQTLQTYDKKLTPQDLKDWDAKNTSGGHFLYYKKGGIHIKPENKGKFNATKKRTGKTTEELTHSKNPVTKKRAVFSQNAKKWKHSKGGLFMYQTTIKQG
jgi:hypothetical protein